MLWFVGCGEAPASSTSSIDFEALSDQVKAGWELAARDDANAVEQISGHARACALTTGFSGEPGRPDARDRPEITAVWFTVVERNPHGTSVPVGC
ncbi:hypothetical protein [Bradyrhizobium iriomotense]|uniref:hypothetical protein n=1 Tax=Bradyrhizobium iriomotense TaxID=441950 RepID=UPI001B89E54B|nr:hypothetical protein [Bradyrhizobium iriomotense]MBR0786877.1 hypothetical protein [Bradyrhizobium iriomotense]